MEIEVTSRSKVLKPMLEKLGKFYAEKLNLTNSKYSLRIITKSSLKKQGVNGMCAVTGPKQITVAIYNRLKPIEVITTLAHEMVHVKQFAKGQYYNVGMKYGKGVNHYWMGKKVNKPYFEQPWEIEAFARQNVLAYLLGKHIAEQLEKQKA